MDREERNAGIKIIGGACLLFLLLAIAPGLTLDYLSCRSTTAAMGKPSSWGPLQGCMVQIRGEWVPLKALRVFEED